MAVAAWNGPPPDLADPRLVALAWALLAPSPHNTQPWRAELSGTDGILLRVDRARLLPVVDADGRQTLIAHGAFLELLALAAGAQGRRAEVALFPDARPDDPPVGAVRLVADTGAAPDPLFAALPQRRSTRLAFDPEKPLKPPHAEVLRQAAAGAAVRLEYATDPEPVGRLRALAREAFELEYALPPALEETVGWMRLGAGEVAARPDGLAIAGTPVWWLTRLGLLSREQLRTPGSLAWRMGRLQWDNLFAGTASFGWLVTARDEPADRIAAGRAYQRLDLAAAANGVAIHPVSQALGDHAATAEARRRLDQLLGIRPPARVQMLFRLGYAGPQPPSPRRPLRAVARG
jgi:hypothetical protein